LNYRCQRFRSLVPNSCLPAFLSDQRVTGDIGLSPAAASFVTGFSLVADFRPV
jgi:hypothetical protein